MELLLAADPALSVYGPLTPVLLLGREFIRRWYKVTVISPKVRDYVRKRFKNFDIEVMDLGIRNFLFSEQSKSFVEYWARESLFHEFQTSKR